MHLSETEQKVLQKIKQIQHQIPEKPVTQLKVYNGAIDSEGLKIIEGLKDQLSKRHLRRIFKKLYDSGKIKKSGHGQYWLPKYLDAGKRMAIYAQFTRRFMEMSPEELEEIGKAVERKRQTRIIQEHEEAQKQEEPFEE